MIKRVGDSWVVVWESPEPIYEPHYIFDDPKERKELFRTVSDCKMKLFKKRKHKMRKAK